MQYQQVCLEALAYTLPAERVTSDEIEARLAPLYQRLRLPAGRLELMTGIRERRFWPVGTLPSAQSIESCERVLAASGIDRSEVGALVHASVCRDHLEPATACRVHHGLSLPAECQIFDVSNACLGILNGMLAVANMIELGQIRAGLVVGSEGSRQLVETTIDWLNRDLTLTRENVKLAVASLTIGSASCAVLLVDRRLSRTQNRLLAATARANTQFHQLCCSGQDEAVADGMSPLMRTDAERLLEAGIATGAETFATFLAEVGWDRDQIDRTFCHQVGSGHRKRMLEALALDPARDFTTLETLGNTGSVALPITMALAAEQGVLTAGDQVALLGIGSGINSLMIGVDWQHAPVRTAESPAVEADLPAIAGAD
ncbi:MAG TPA: 3-oxoacyl-ACP synthase III [Pirellulales bacterium]|jgi:3-oxoacyl-[acyl-carrier-protein] synthase-3|nr:3-oxoacyl-ACP synthase III [Pirellulales bacterium]